MSPKKKIYFGVGVWLILIAISAISDNFKTILISGTGLIFLFVSLQGLSPKKIIEKIDISGQKMFEENNISDIEEVKTETNFKLEEKKDKEEKIGEKEILSAN